MNTGDDDLGYTEVEYRQFSGSKGTRLAMTAFGILMWPLAIPLALLSRLTDTLFRSFSEALALVPYFPGIILRYEFYRFALRRCGKNVITEMGAVFVYRDVEVGSDVLIGRFAIVHLCDIGSHVLIGERCTLLSGGRQHRIERTDIPMALQGGARRRTRVGDDVWIGSHAVIMADVAQGSVVAAGAVVKDRVEPFSIVGGVPARMIRSRK
jgi:acetyltransferase-like isoleucine patch superfamily enzyme